jgi:hypothetical protein
MKNPAMKKDQRKNQRKPFERRAWIETNDRISIAECILGNLSATGAKLIVKDEIDLPVNFILRLSSDGRVARKCRLAWHSGNEIGVEFVARLVSAPTRPHSAGAS